MDTVTHRFGKTLRFPTGVFVFFLRCTWRYALVYMTTILNRGGKLVAHICEQLKLS